MTLFNIVEAPFFFYCWTVYVCAYMDWSIEQEGSLVNTHASEY